MKEYNDIQFLFEKAAKEPVQISFDETQKAFAAALSSGTATATTKSFWAKNWILMISTAITVAIGASVLFTLPKASSKTADNVTPTVTETEQPQQQHTNTSVSHKTTTPTTRKTAHLTPDGERLEPKPIEFTPSMKRQQVLMAAALPLRQKWQKQAPYRFPELTDEEKKANEKRKKEMVKNFVKLDKHSYAYIPSGSFLMDTQVVSVQAFYIQKHEVTNIQYKTFLFDLLINDRKDDFLAAKPDQEKWVEHYGEGMRPMTKTYFSEEAYDNYPVVNVSRKGAEMYCYWLTQQVHAYTEKHGEVYMNDIRLPQREEWAYAAAGGDTSMLYPIAKDSLKNEKGCYLANYKPLPDNFHADGGFNTVKVDSYNPNIFGLYNMAGNVAEMVYESSFRRDLPTPLDKIGTAGGSWETGEEALQIYGPDPYSKIEDAHPAIGFRVVSSHLRRN